MKILYRGLFWNYGNQKEGTSYEHENFEAGLAQYCKQKGWELHCSYPDVNGQDNIHYLSQSEKYDIFINFEFNESTEICQDVVNYFKKQGTILINWSSDSSWRFQDFILPRKNKFDWFITTHSCTVPWYKAEGMKVIRSQWAGIDRYIPEYNTKFYDVSFVGQKYNHRHDVVNFIQKIGINLHLFGNYWEGFNNWHGYLTDYNLAIEVFNRSRINLNFSWPYQIGTMSQVKGRLFELPSARAFQITTPADDLDRYFEPGKEIIVVSSVNEMVDQILYYLDHEEEREQIADAAYKRVLKEHTWDKRFDEIFSEIGINV